MKGSIDAWTAFLSKVAPHVQLAEGQLPAREYRRSSSLEERSQVDATITFRMNTFGVSPTHGVPHDDTEGNYIGCGAVRLK